MKRIFFISAIIPFVVAACGNEPRDSVEKADSINAIKSDSNDNKTPLISTDKESIDFLVDAANAGMTEIQLGQSGQQKATNAGVKNFAAMLVDAYSATHSQIKTLAGPRNITLPVTPGDAKQNTIDELNKKTGIDFDRSLMRILIDEHQKEIDLFQKASDRVNDSEIKTFIDNTLPKLRMHLDSARIVQKLIK